MKQIILLTLTFFSLKAFAQNEVVININHKLADVDFGFNQESANNNGVAFNVDRLEYYLSGFVLIHDGGMETPVSDVYALVDAGDNTQISLGNLTFTDIEGVKFSVGVDQATNHLDPASYPQNHPLAPKNPSMHWGWTSGYRFVAMEGNGGSSLSTPYEIHALGDNNYLRQTVMVSSELENNKAIINIDADYSRALFDIDVSTGIITHGDFAEAVDLLNNFQTDVFKASPDDTVIIDPTTSILNNEIVDFNVFPNPSNGIFVVDVSDLNNVSEILIYNVLGEKVQDAIVVDNKIMKIDIDNKGVFLVSIQDALGKVIANSTVILE